MQISFWMSTPGGRPAAPNALTFYRWCLCMWGQQGGENMSGPFAKATGNCPLGWTLKCKSPLFSSLGLTPQEMKSRNSTTKFINSKGHWALNHVAWRRQRSWPGKSSALWQSTCGKGGVLPIQWNRVLPVLQHQTTKQSSLGGCEWGAMTQGVIERTCVTMPLPKPGRPTGGCW